ncbi:MAG: hypothetical protein EBS69_06965 [Verrucomicrobia bacterium]|nr:hypothetical protein [Verrucomicrobiota bacterium]NBT24485.1 hypothetical protein [bacterium]
MYWGHVYLFRKPDFNKKKNTLARENVSIRISAGDQLLSVTTSLRNILELDPLLILKILLSQPLETPV